MSPYELLLTVSAVILFFYYRASCLRISNRYGEKAVKVLERIYASEEISDGLKIRAHRQFLILPGLLLPLFLPFSLVGILIRRTIKGNKKKDTSEVSEFMNDTDYKEFSRLLWQMAFSRRPLLWACSLMLSVCLVFVLSAIISMFSSRTAALIRGNIIESFNPHLMKVFSGEHAR